MMKTALLICLVPGPHNDSRLNLIITLHESNCMNDEIRQKFISFPDYFL